MINGQVKPLSDSYVNEIYLSSKGKIYKDPTQKIGNKEIWYSKDIDQHGGSGYKLFVEKKTHFAWIGDADEFGNIMQNKHKSEKGKKISKKDLMKKK